MMTVLVCGWVVMVDDDSVSGDDIGDPVCGFADNRERDVNFRIRTIKRFDKLNI